MAIMIQVEAARTAFTLLMLSGFSRVRLFATPWTVARQAPLSMGFSRQPSNAPHLLFQQLFTDVLASEPGTGIQQ